jgi:cyclic pyranopterin phosphate synthase
MPVGHDPTQAGLWRDRFVSAAEIRATLEAALGQLAPIETEADGPAQRYRLPGREATVGFIAAVSHRFCSTCNRLRLTADGQLRPCLLSDREIDLRTPLRRGADRAALQTLLRQAILAKPERHHLDGGERAEARAMAQIGG